jgi:ribokinase
VRTLLNPAPASPLPDELLALTDVLTPNETELLALAGPEHATADEAAAELLRRGVGAVIATLGSAGCRLWRADGAGHAVPGWRMEAVVDTVGAGDTFTGSLAAALARGEALEAGMANANAAAALSVTGRGAIGGMPSLQRTRELLGTRREG